MWPKPQKKIGGWIEEYPVAFILIIALALLSAWLLSPQEQVRRILAPDGSDNRYTFGGSVSLGQEFIPPVGLHKIILPVRAEAMPSGPLILHLRETYFGHDIRTSIVFQVEEEQGDISFSFPSLFNPPAKAIWIIEASHNTNKSFALFREHDAAAFLEGKAYNNNRPIVGNFGFTLVHYQPRIIEWWQQTAAASQSWEWLTIIIGFGLAAIVPYINVRPKIVGPQQIIFLMAAVSVIAHVVVSYHLPIVNDEGAYIQDALQTKPGFLPLRDFLTKGPLYIGLLKVWQWLTPHTVTAWRLLAALSWGVGTIAIALLVRQLHPHRSGTIFAFLFALLPASVALTTPLLLQTTSVPLMLIGLLLAAKGAQQQRPAWLAASGLVMNLAFLIRVNSVIGAGLGLFLILWLTRSGWRWRALIIYSVSGLSIFFSLFGLSVLMLGLAKALVVFNAEAFLIAGQRAVMTTDETDLWLRLVLKHAATFWQAGVPLLFGLPLLPLLLDRQKGFLSLIIRTIVMLSLIYFSWWHLADMQYLLPQKFVLIRLVVIGLIFIVPLVFLVIRQFTPRLQPHKDSMTIVWLGVLWLILLLVVYTNWGRFRQSYLVEFIPPLTLLTGFCLTAITHYYQSLKPRWLGKIITVSVTGLMITSYLQGSIMMWRYPHTGTINHENLQTVVSAVRNHVPADQPLFTAQPIITAFSWRPIIFGYSHPGWIREERLGFIPADLRRLYFAEPEVITDYLEHTANYVLMDRRTLEIYFDGFPERKTILKNQFELISQIASDLEQEPFQLYRRRLTPVLQ